MYSKLYGSTTFVGALVMTGADGTMEATVVGRRDGFTNGFTDVFFADGFADGFADSFPDGFADGFPDDFADGFPDDFPEVVLQVGERDDTDSLDDGDTVGSNDGSDKDEMPVIVTFAIHVKVEKQPILKVIVGVFVTGPGTVYVKVELPPAVPQESSSKASCLSFLSTSRM